MGINSSSMSLFHFLPALNKKADWNKAEFLVGTSQSPRTVSSKLWLCVLGGGAQYYEQFKKVSCMSEFLKVFYILYTHINSVLGFSPSGNQMSERNSIH